MTIMEVIAAVAGYLEKEYDLLNFIKRTIWDSARKSAFYITKPNYKDLYNERQLWHHSWDAETMESRMDEINRKLELGAKIFPKEFPTNLN